MSGPLSIRTIGEAVAALYGVDWKEIRSERRDRHLVRPRHVGMWAARRYARASNLLIGKVFDRDHAVVDYAFKRIEAIAGTDDRVRVVVAVLDRMTAEAARAGSAPLTPAQTEAIETFRAAAQALGAAFPQEMHHDQ